MAKGGSRLAEWAWKARRSSLNSDAPLLEPKLAQERVLGIQRKLHKWAQDDQGQAWEAGWIARRDPICGPERLENLVA